MEVARIKNSLNLLKKNFSEENTMAITDGDKVKIDYTGTFEDGTEFDSSKKHGQPLEFQVGTHQIIKGFENALIGMSKDEEKSITLQPEEGYGDINPENVKDIPRDQLPKEELKIGMMLVMQLPNGAQMPAKIIEVGETTVKLDLNHPLAGKILKFDFKVLEVTESSLPTPEEQAEQQKKMEEMMKKMAEAKKAAQESGAAGKEAEHEHSESCCGGEKTDSCCTEEEKTKGSCCSESLEEAVGDSDKKEEEKTEENASEEPIVEEAKEEEAKPEENAAPEPVVEEAKEAETKPEESTEEKKE